MSDDIEDFWFQLAALQAGETMKLTEAMRDGFRAVGCDPTCHLCKAKLDVGARFGLVRMPKPGSMTRSHRLMACAKCVDNPDPALVNAAQAEAAKRLADLEDQAGMHPGCFFDEEGRPY